MSRAREIFNSKPVPVPGAVVDLRHITQSNNSPEYWVIVVYANNLGLLAGTDQERVISWCERTRDKMREHDIDVWIGKDAEVPR